MLALNKSVFQVDSAPLTDDEIAHAFADAQLLSELTLHKSDCHQLLITNDRKLSCDAFELNQQQSCKGRRILVCYVNGWGELQCCECARPAVEKKADTTLDVDKESVQPRSAADNPLNTASVEEVREAETHWHFDWKSGVIGISSVGILYGLYKVCKSLLH